MARERGWARYDEFVQETLNQMKIGGDLQRAIVYSTLALAEATALTDPDNSRLQVEVTGALTVDS